jgi:hypothetical protein
VGPDPVCLHPSPEAAQRHAQLLALAPSAAPRSPADEPLASWYAEWLVTLSELPELLGAEVARSELTYLLVRLDKEHTERHPDERWEDYYARELVRHFRIGGGRWHALLCAEARLNACGGTAWARHPPGSERPRRRP